MSEEYIPEVLSFKMGKEEYAVDIQNVKEIKENMPTHRVPNSPEYMEGIFQLRGDVIPLMNLRKALKLPEEKHEDAKKPPVIIILDINGKNCSILVDSVSDVVQVEKSQQQPAPYIKGVDPDKIHSLITIEDRMLITLNMDKVFSIQ